MSVLKRKMFSRGGMAVSRGTGITSGLATPKRGYVDGPGSYAGKKTLADFQSESKTMLDNIYQPSPPRNRLRDASPALMQFFGALASGKSLQGGFGGALDILGTSLQQSAPAFQEVISARRAAESADRKEQMQMDLQALQMAREDYADYLDKFKPFQFGENTLRYNEETDSYDTIATKPPKLIQVYNSETDQKEFVPESLIRAEAELRKEDPSYVSKYLVEKEVTDIVEAYNNDTKKFEYISQDALNESVEKGDGKYSPKAPEMNLVEVFDTREDRNVFISESALNSAIEADNNRYAPKKENLDTFKEVFSTSLGANIYVTQGDLLADKSKETPDFSAPKEDPTFKTFFDPILKKNVLATDEDVAERLKDNDPKNDLLPKNVEQKDTILTLKNKTSGQNMLVSQEYALNNLDKFEPADKAQTTKSAIDTKNDNKLVFVTNKDIEDNPGRYQPAILGQSLVIDQNGKVTLKEDLVGTGDGADATTKQQDRYLILEDLNISTQELLAKLEDVPESYFGITGGIIDFYNKYITQLGLPFNEQAAQIRNDINILGQSILTTISGDSRFTNEDREYIQEITGKEAMDKMQSYEQILNAVSQTQLLLQDRLAETAGVMGVRPSYDLSPEDLYNSYNNFRLDNKLSVPEGFVRRNDLPSFNLAQVKRRLKAYHYDIYNQYYTPDGRNKPQDN